MSPNDACILNTGSGAWAFADLANHLSRALWLDITETPRQHTYLLHTDDPATLPQTTDLFIPLHAIDLAADKRLLAQTFAAHHVPTPETHLLDSLEDAKRLAAAHPTREWCLKYPTACGAAGHRLLTPDLTIPEDWPRPYILQEFIRLQTPEVYRLYATAGHLFNFVARRFPLNTKPSPWVAHAHGARYADAAPAPPEALATARAALAATDLLDSFGCADLIRRPTGQWLALEVGTDGLHNHVDRDLNLPHLERELQHRLAESFWQRLGPTRPWHPAPWHPRPTP